jgi:hypothetical protein
MVTKQSLSKKKRTGNKSHIKSAYSVFNISLFNLFMWAISIAFAYKVAISPLLTWKYVIGWGCVAGTAILLRSLVISRRTRRVVTR